MKKTNELWWIDYRRNQYKPKIKMNKETLIRKSLVEAFKEYVNNCPIGIIRHIFQSTTGQSSMERFTWTLLFAAMLCFLGFFLYQLQYDTLQKPLVVTMETPTYPITNIDFPAVAICNVNRISRSAAISVTERSYPLIQKHPLYNSQQMPKEQLLWLLLQLGRLVDFSYSEALRKDHFIDFLEKYSEKNPNVISGLMNMLTPNCTEMLKTCAWSGTKVDCMSIFETHFTFHGHCCTFNYALKFDHNAIPIINSGAVRRQTNAGVLRGLTVVMDPLVEDYAYPLFNINGFEDVTERCCHIEDRVLVIVCNDLVLIFDPKHFADPSAGRVMQRYVEPNSAVLLELQSIKQIATREVRKYSPATRKCVFRDERSKTYGDGYSYNICILKCRIETMKSLCKCIPYFLQNIADNGPICSLDDLYCLNKYKEKFLYLYPMNALDPKGLEMELQDSLYCPDCLPDCEYTKHFTRSFVVPVTHSDHASGSRMKHLFKITNETTTNISTQCLLSVYQANRRATLDRLDVVSYWFEVLSNVGGVIGILIGFSMITIAEAVYFLFLRLFVIINLNYRQNNLQ